MTTTGYILNIFLHNRFSICERIIATPYAGQGRNKDNETEGPNEDQHAEHASFCVDPVVPMRIDDHNKPILKSKSNNIRNHSTYYVQFT